MNEKIIVNDWVEAKKVWFSKRTLYISPDTTFRGNYQGDVTRLFMHALFVDV